MKDKILITGCNGQLGSELAKLLPQAILTDVDTLDITNQQAVSDFVKQNNVDLIINCAAYTAVDKAEDNPELAAKINIDGPKNLALSGAKIIHISTDYVFEGTNCRPYEPEDKTKPVSVYGKTKLAGEQEVLKHAKCAIIIRTAWLYSPYGGNFVKTIRKLGAEKESISVVNDQIGTPTCAADLAQAIVEIIPQMNESNKGVYHFSDEGVCSWYDFAHEIMALSKLDCLVKPIPSSAYPTKAKRPFYSVLSKEKIKNTFHIEIPYWKDSLVKCLKQF